MLAALSAVAVARPGHSGGGGGGGGFGGSSFGSSGFGGGVQLDSYAAPIGGGGGGGSGGQYGAPPPQYGPPQQAPVVHKHVYVHVPPPEPAYYPAR